MIDVTWRTRGFQGCEGERGKGRAVNPLRNMEKGLGRWRDSGG